LTGRGVRNFLCQQTLAPFRRLPILVLCFERRVPNALGFCLVIGLGLASAMDARAAGSGPAPDPAHPPGFFRTYCFECHGTTKPKGKISLERLVAQESVGPHADDWENVAEMLDSAEMPPAEAKLFPTDGERTGAAAWVRAALKSYESVHAGEPGRVTVRRLTSGEYGYAVRDLTGIDLDVGVDASSDAVGGEGFINFGEAPVGFAGRR